MIKEEFNLVTGHNDIAIDAETFNDDECKRVVLFITQRRTNTGEIVLTEKEVKELRDRFIELYDWYMEKEEV